MHLGTLIYFTTLHDSSTGTYAARRPCSSTQWSGAIPSRQEGCLWSPQANWSSTVSSPCWCPCGSCRSPASATALCPPPSAPRLRWTWWSQCQGGLQWWDLEGFSGRTFFYLLFPILWRFTFVIFFFGPNVSNRVRWSTWVNQNTVVLIRVCGTLQPAKQEFSRG